MNYINERNCKRLTNHEWEDLISLTGILGIHTIKELNTDIVKYAHLEIDEKIAIIEYETDLIAELLVRIDLNSKIIRNERFVSKKIKSGLGFPRLCAQVDAARKHKFKKIILHAYGDFKIRKRWCGYIVWAKYGFQMIDSDDVAYFKHLAKDKFKTIYDMVIDKRGIKVWEKRGREWLAEFNLSYHSYSMKILRKERRARKQK